MTTFQSTAYACAIAACGWLVSPLGYCDETTRLGQTSVVSQRTIGENACGPCALYNALTNGGPELSAICSRLAGESPESRIRGLITQYGAKPSELYAKKRNRYTDAHGMSVEDLLALANDVLNAHSGPELSGSYLDRQSEESGPLHLRRVHQILTESLKSGFPPIVDIRSFSARPQDLVGRLQGEESKWNGLYGHLIAIVELQPRLNEQDSGFWFRYADSSSGKVESGFIHAEQARPFKAPKSFTVTDDGKEQWEWLSGFPFLLVTAPTQTLRMQLEPSHTRTFITLRYAIYREASVLDRD